MAEYIECEKLIKHLKKDPLFDLVERYGITGVIEAIHAADVRPVVRGKDILALTKRKVYRGDVYNALEAERINHLDGILSDRYKEGFHDGLKRALEILGGLQDVEEGKT